MTGAALRRQRKVLGLTQKELAQAVGMTSTSIARYERNEVGIPEPVARLVLLLKPIKKARR